MPEYWFVVSPALEDLYEALKTLVADKPGFHVVKDRRLVPGTGPSGERRIAHVWNGDGIIIAEQDSSPQLKTPASA